MSAAESSPRQPRASVQPKNVGIIEPAAIRLRPPWDAIADDQVEKIQARTGMDAESARRALYDLVIAKGFEAAAVVVEGA